MTPTPPAIDRERQPSDQAFEIVSEWLRSRGEAANGPQLFAMCTFADFVLARAALSTQPQQATAEESSVDGWRLDVLERVVLEQGELHLHDGNHPRGLGLGFGPNLGRDLRQAIDALSPPAPSSVLEGGGR